MTDDSEVKFYWSNRFGLSVWVFNNQCCYRPLSYRGSQRSAVLPPLYLLSLFKMIVPIPDLPPLEFADSDEKKVVPSYKKKRDPQLINFMATSYHTESIDWIALREAGEFKWLGGVKHNCPTTGLAHYHYAGCLKKKLARQTLQTKFGCGEGKVLSSGKQCKGNCMFMQSKYKASKFSQLAEYVRESDADAIAGSHWEFGDLPEDPTGVNDDYILAMQDIREGNLRAYDLLRLDPQMYHQFGRSLHAQELEYERKLQPEGIISVLRPWQTMVRDIAISPWEERKIHWIVDEPGLAGKSKMVKYLMVKHGACLLGFGYADCAAAYQKQPIVCWDIGKDTEDKFIPYAVMEALKNGMIFSQKYNSFTKIFTPPHVFVFSNNYPRMDAFSQDRWNIIDLYNFNLQVHPQ